jgi:plastocyanin
LNFCATKIDVRWLSAAVLCAMTAVSIGMAQEVVEVTALVEVTHQHRHESPMHAASGDVVVWLTPLQKLQHLPETHKQVYTLAQKNKQFTPHILVVPTGSSINFPNLDPFFHNVFSLFDGKRFDLGLYEAHTRRVVQFDKEGVSYIFCNIHPEMGAVVVSLSTPFYGVSTPDGAVVLHDVPPGSYRLNVWAENVSRDLLNGLSRTVEITDQDNQLGTLRLQTSGDIMEHHENKFGESYAPVAKDPY